MGRKNPNAVRQFLGDPNKDRHNPDEPVAPAGRPTVRDFGPRGNAEATRIMDEMELLGVLAITDRALIEAYATVWVREEAARSAIKRLGYFPSKVGVGRVKNPAVGVMEECSRQKRMLLVEMGLTPSARARLKSNPEAVAKSKKGVEKFIGGPDGTTAN